MRVMERRVLATLTVKGRGEGRGRVVGAELDSVGPGA